MSYDHWLTGGASPDWDPVEDERDVEVIVKLVHAKGDREGEVVNPGDLIADFRGDLWKFQMVTRDNKVCVSPLEGTGTRIYYPSVFDCEIQEVEGGDR